MRWLFLLLACAAISLPARAEARLYEQAELEALLAPVALQQDAVLWNVLAAATTPDQLAEAAQWTRMNRGMTGGDAVRAVQERPWSPAVKALVAHPELLERMAESPQWAFDLGNAYLAQEQEVLATVQSLRQRAYAAGTLQSDSVQTVQRQGEVLAVQPAVPHIYHVRYYDPLVVYGPWWLSYRPVLWRPWAPRPVFVNHVVVVSKPLSPAARLQQRSTRDFLEREKQHRPSLQPYHRIPESRRQPIVQSGERLRAPALDSRPHQRGRHGGLGHGASPSRNAAADPGSAPHMGTVHPHGPRSAGRGIPAARSGTARPGGPRYRN